jgi:hypothetical protein
MNPFLKYSLTAALLIAGAGSVQAQTFTRKPFLQMGSPTKASVCWRISAATALNVKFGTDSLNLNRTTAASLSATDACVVLDSLQPATKYFYQVYNGTTLLPTNTNQYVKTHPVVGSRAKHEFWILGDPGSGTVQQARVRDSYYSVNGGNHSDGILMLGDNAYESGTDAEHTSKLFGVYDQAMANSFMWPAIGNHENITSGATGHLGAWYLPTTGQSGGVASGSELYFSVDYGNVHLVILDSERSPRDTAGAQYQWLKQDLAATTADWIVAYWHHPSYTWGSHNSDTESKHPDMRTRFQPLLEKYGVDLVFAGHSHDYERSFLLDSAYGTSTQNVANRAKQFKDTTSGNPATTGPYRKTPGANKGAVYTVAGSSGKLDVVTEIDGKHPVMYVQHLLYGSVILTVQDSIATVKFIDTARTVRDQFQIVKSRPPVSISGKQDRTVRPALAAKFVQMGRRFDFDADNAVSFRVYSPDGSVAYEGVPKGRWEPARTAVAPGEYYYRFGSTFGRLSLP